MSRRVAVLMGLMLVVVWVGPAHAQGATVLDDVVAEFQRQAGAWGPILRGFAMGTFYLLACIELVWVFGMLALRAPDLSEILAEIVRQILSLGFFWLLLLNSDQWGRLIIQSFRAAGLAASGGGVNPSSVLLSGIEMAKKVIDMASIWNAAASAGLMVAGIVIIIAFAFIAACMVETLVESYIAIGASVILMAFGGSRWTRETAIAAIRYPLSVGAKLMMMQLLVGIGQNFVTTWSRTLTTLDTNGIALMIGASVVLAVVTRTIPDRFQRIVGGHAAGNALPAAAAATAGVASGVALGAIGAGAAANSAFGLAGEQMKAADAAAAEQNGGQAPQRSSIARAASMTGGAVKNLGGAAARDVGRRLTGDIGSQHGIASWRMNADLSNKRRLLADDAEKPALGGGGSGGFRSGGTGSERSEPWMSMTGGFGAMSQTHQDSARRSYSAWAEDNPELAARHGLESYVSYVQDKQSGRNKPRNVA